MKKIILVLVALYSVNCANVYSPTGVKGKDAKKEIEDTRAALTPLSLMSLMTLSSGSSTTTTSVVCDFSSSPTSSVSATTIGNFDVPKLNNTLDLGSASTGQYYFRSRSYTPESTTGTITAKSLVTSSVTTANTTCRYIASSSACSSDLSGLSWTSATSMSSSSTTISITSGNCLAIRCDGASAIRIKNASTTSSFSSSSSAFNPADMLLGPELFNQIAAIDDDKYYTKESVDACKDAVTNITLLQQNASTAAFQSFMNESRQVSTCNTLTPSLPSSNGLAYQALQGSSCALEEVGFFGVF